MILNKTCKHCQHFFRHPVDPHNLGAPRGGECREQVHVIVLPAPAGVRVAGCYAPLPEDFPACGRFRPLNISLEECHVEEEGGPAR